MVRYDIINPAIQKTIRRKAFYSNTSFNDAIKKAARSGFRVAGKVKNENGQFVVFGRKAIDNQFRERRQHPFTIPTRF